jgi:hypothetical protein
MSYKDTSEINWLQNGDLWQFSHVRNRPSKELASSSDHLKTSLDNLSHTTGLDLELKKSSGIPIYSSTNFIKSGQSFVKALSALDIAIEEIVRSYIKIISPVQRFVEAVLPQDWQITYGSLTSISDFSDFCWSPCLSQMENEKIWFSFLAAPAELPIVLQSPDYGVNWQNLDVGTSSSGSDVNFGNSINTRAGNMLLSSADFIIGAYSKYLGMLGSYNIEKAGAYDRNEGGINQVSCSIPTESSFFTPTDYWNSEVLAPPYLDSNFTTTKLLYLDHTYHYYFADSSPYYEHGKPLVDLMTSINVRKAYDEDVKNDAATWPEYSTTLAAAEFDIIAKQSGVLLAAWVDQAGVLYFGESNQTIEGDLFGESFTSNLISLGPVRHPSIVQLSQGGLVIFAISLLSGGLATSIVYYLSDDDGLTFSGPFPLIYGKYIVQPRYVTTVRMSNGKVLLVYYENSTAAETGKGWKSIWINIARR